MIPCEYVDLPQRLLCSRTESAMSADWFQQIGRDYGKAGIVSGLQASGNTSCDPQTLWVYCMPYVLSSHPMLVSEAMKS